MDIFEHNTHTYQIFCDSLQEGRWFQNLNINFAEAELIIIPNTMREKRLFEIDRVLQYDRPDIILKDNGNIIFVLERTVEVPSGHNVGQRFGRLAAAAQERIPVVYFGPYMAYKHGGATAGPRYMNLRLFYSLQNLSQRYNTAVTTINWPVDVHCEVLRTPQKDERLIEYLNLFLTYYNAHGFEGLTEYIKESAFQQEQYAEQIHFARRTIQNPEQYNVPPDSVEIMPVTQFINRYVEIPDLNPRIQQIELYHIGMTYIRSDPYAGMSALYHYLYGSDDVVQILHFPNIPYENWLNLRHTTKTYRMFREFSYAILFEDQLVLHNAL